jgi:hypothetical protein
MKNVIFFVFFTCLIAACADSGDTYNNDPVFVQHFRNGQYPDASYDGCQDTYMRSDAPSTTNGSSTNVIVVSGSSGYIYRGLIRFDILGALPAGVAIKKAILTLNLNSSVSEENDPDPATFNMDAMIYVNNASYGTPGWDDYTWEETSFRVSTATFEVNNSYGAIEIPAYVIENWVENDLYNYGLVLEVKNESIHEGAWFSSSDSVDAYSRPMLSVFYTY